MNSGVYAITNPLNGDSYVGSSGNLRQRRLSHFSALRKGRHQNRLLQASFDKAGGGLQFGILETCPIKSCKQNESSWIGRLSPNLNKRTSPERIGGCVRSLGRKGVDITLPPDLIRRLDAIAEGDGSTRSDLIEEAIKALLTRREREPRKK